MKNTINKENKTTEIEKTEIEKINQDIRDVTNRINNILDKINYSTVKKNND